MRLQVKRTRKQMSFWRGLGLTGICISLYYIVGDYDGYIRLLATVSFLLFILITIED